MAEMNELLDEAVREVDALSLRAREDRAEVADLARRVRERTERLRGALEEAHRTRTDAGRRVADAARELAEDVREAARLHDELQAQAERAGASATDLATHIGEGVESLEAAIARSREHLDGEIRRLREDIAGRIEAANAARLGLGESARRLREETATKLAGSIENAGDTIADGKRDLVQRLQAHKERAIEMAQRFTEAAVGAEQELAAGLAEALSSLAERSEQAAAEVRDALTGEALEELGRARVAVGGELDSMCEAVVAAAGGAAELMKVISTVGAKWHDTQRRVVENLR